jgi:hypothetical protein
MALAAALASPAAAQEVATPANEAPSEGSAAVLPDHAHGRTVFTPADFARFAPRNAHDMLVQLPGFVIREGESARGLGQATTNVLVNGQRIAGKSEDPLAPLSRIAAANVVRIEIVDGATLQLPGLTGQVANIIVTSGGLTGQFRWKGEMRPHFTDPLFSQGEISISGKTGSLDYTFGLENDGSRGGAGGPTRVIDAGGALIETRSDALTSYWDAPKVTGSFKLAGPGSSEANLNFEYRRYFQRFQLADTRHTPGQADSYRSYRQNMSGHNGELGGDLAFGLGPGRLKVIGLYRFDHEPETQQALTRFADGRPTTGDRFIQLTDTSEAIARAEYGWKLGGADWQLSTEAAFNRLATDASLDSLDSSGQFVPVPFPSGSGGVKEARFETMLSYSRPLGSHLSLQLSAGGEYSRLSQSGANAASRSFRRAKGSLSLAWTPRKGLDISLKAARRVGQLEFGDFLAAVFLDDNNANAGNSDLVPPQSWEFDLELKKDLGRWGTTTLRLYDRRIEDLVDFIPIGTDGESLGNLPRARRHGAEWTTTLKLDPLGFTGARFDAHIVLERSRVRDPLTGIMRSISETEDRIIELDLRHDIPRTPLAWGVHLGTYHFTDQFRLTERGLNWEGPTWLGIFIEHKDVFGLTVNARAGNLLNARNRFDRTVYQGFRSSSAVAFEEHRARLIGPIFSLTVKGGF